MSEQSVSRVEVSRWVESGQTTVITDLVAVEEPLQVVIDGRPLAVLMRTPSDS